MKPSLELSRLICHLDFNLIFLFFWSRPSDFKSSFKLRKGHFPQFSALKNFHLPLKVIVQEGRNHMLGFWGQLEMSLWTLGFGRSHLSQAWKCTVLKKVASLCTHVIFKKERAVWRGLRFDHEKSAQWQQNDNEWALEFKSPDVLKTWGEGQYQFSIQFGTPYQKTIFKSKKGLRAE